MAEPSVGERAGSADKRVLAADQDGPPRCARTNVLARAGPYACSSRAGGLLQQVPVTAEVAVDIAARIGLGGQGRYGIRARRRDARRGRDFRQILLLPGISWPDHP